LEYNKKTSEVTVLPFWEKTAKNARYTLPETGP
jgi:hypothetical protein